MVAGTLSAARSEPSPAWPEIRSAAEGQTVYWHAWGGDENVNRYISWVSDQVREKFGLTLRHVKIGNASETVTLLLAEKAGGRATGGRVDLLWLNGENFAALKKSDLLYGPFTQHLPNFNLVDTEDKPTTVVDFTVPTEGFEAPWGMAQLIFFADTDHVQNPPGSARELRAWTAQNPGRFAYPAPPDFTGTTFLKQVLTELVDDPSSLYAPVSQSDFEQVTAPLWAYLDALHPHLWRQGRAFPLNYPALRQMMNDGAIDIALSFNPAEVASAVFGGQLPDTVRPFVFDSGTIGNTHFVAIPASAPAKEGAMVVANFLLSPAAQAHKAKPDVWGDPTVLDLEKLGPDLSSLFNASYRSSYMLSPHELRRTLQEPHPSWTERLETAWQERYHR